jgi:hypothetical protein
VSSCRFAALVNQPYGRVCEHSSARGRSSQAWSYIFLREPSFSLGERCAWHSLVDARRMHSRMPLAKASLLPGRISFLLTCQGSPLSYADCEGRVVTAEECYLLAYRMKAVGDARVQRFVAFCVFCVSRDGFRLL